MPDWLNFLRRLTYPNYDILLCDNSADTAYHKTIELCGFPCLYVAPQGRDVKYYMAESRNKIRNYALANNYDYFLSIECDIFTPVNVIEKLLCANLPVVGASYHIGNGLGTFKLIENYSLQDTFLRHYCRPVIDSFYFTDGTIKQVYGAGLGCMLISRAVLEQIIFRCDDEITGPDDKFFNRDCSELEIPIHIDTSIAVTHYNKDWKTIFDYKDTKLWYKNLQQFNFNS